MKPPELLHHIGPDLSLTDSELEWVIEYLRPRHRIEDLCLSEAEVKRAAHRQSLQRIEADILGGPVEEEPVDPENPWGDTFPSVNGKGGVG
jgi:hypothetical protein